jgi:hypothetical protein
VESSLPQTADRIVNINKALFMSGYEHSERANHFQPSSFGFVAPMTFVNDQCVSLKVQSQRDRFTFTRRAGSPALNPLIRVRMKSPASQDDVRSNVEPPQAF